MTAKGAWLQPAGAPVSGEVVVVPCVPVSGLCLRVATRCLYTEEQRDESSGVALAAERLHAEAWGSTGSRDVVRWGSGGPCGHYAAGLAVVEVLK